ncbi:MAG: glutathione S-transferase C-terminal domain-containing protein [Nocardioidaceae bacterium]|nr:glutathione S-transferase C-terminal domain-containing protein [Nocardioidaceae bacterium]
MTTTDTAQFGAETGSAGEFTRQRNRFDARISADGADGWPVEAGRYRLAWSRACPWAHRARIVLGLLGLEDAISLATVDPVRDDAGWRFTLDEGGRDPELGIAYLSEAYLATDPAYEGRVTVPCIIDVVSGQVVTNDFGQLTLDLSTEWAAHHRPGAPQLYPEALRDEIDAVNADVYRDVNNGVYRAGFASSQQAYEQAYDALFERLDQLEQRLSTRRYLVGTTITEADVRLFTTIVRFDAVYHGHFKCNRNKVTEMPALWGWARDVFQTPGFGDTVDFDHIKRHYYVTHDRINPTGVVPKGPDPAVWSTPHGRESLTT